MRVGTVVDFIAAAAAAEPVRTVRMMERHTEKKITATTLRDASFLLPLYC